MIEQEGEEIERMKKLIQKSKAMVYLFNEHIPPKKIIQNALTAIYGIGRERAKEIGNVLCLNQSKRFGTAKIATIRKISKFIAKKYKVGGILRKQVTEDIKRKIRIRSYQGIRHRDRLPVRGQRTHTNAQTQRKR